MWMEVVEARSVVEDMVEARRWIECDPSLKIVEVIHTIECGSYG
jgi:hypothetical protein